MLQNIVLDRVMKEKMFLRATFDHFLRKSSCHLEILNTVSAPFEPRGSIFQNGFLSGVLLIFDLPGVVIETGVY